MGVTPIYASPRVFELDGFLSGDEVNHFVSWAVRKKRAVCTRFAFFFFSFLSFSLLLLEPEIHREVSLFLRIRSSF